MYKDRFDGWYVTNTGDIMIRIDLNRRDVSGQDNQIHASLTRKKKEKENQDQFLICYAKKLPVAGAAQEIHQRVLN